MPNFETSVTLACELEQAFDFLIRPANIVKISPPEMGLRFVEAPEAVVAGSRLEFKVQGWGQVQTMVHEITSVVRPTLFTERQLKGPFKLWVHEHVLATTGDGQVIVTDRIEFEPPGGLIGLLVTKSKIFEHLEDAFFHRHGELRKLLEAAP